MGQSLKEQKTSCLAEALNCSDHLLQEMQPGSSHWISPKQAETFSIHPP